MTCNLITEFGGFEKNMGSTGRREERSRGWEKSIWEKVLGACHLSRSLPPPSAAHLLPLSPTSNQQQYRVKVFVSAASVTVLTGHGHQIKQLRVDCMLNSSFTSPVCLIYIVFLLLLADTLPSHLSSQSATVYCC